MTSSERIKDLADVQELIKICKLARDFRAHLDPYVHGKFDELWDAALGVPKRFMLIWRDRSPEGMARLAAMQGDGVTMDPDAPGDDHARLITTDPGIAAKYGMHDEAEFFDEEG